MSFAAKERNALERNGWQVIGNRLAARDYRGGLRSLITPNGKWALHLGSELRGQRFTRWQVVAEGAEPDVILAAMESNEQAWRRPEYAAAKYGAN